jgi:hypothetical protein
MWVAALDGRTCFYCANLDGKMWDLDLNPIGLNPYKFPQNLTYPNCRCCLSPILKRSGPVFDREDLGRASPSTRASMNGQVPNSWDYLTWFKHQPEDFQLKYLGPERYELWKHRRIYFHQLVDLDGNFRTIEQLNEIAEKQKLKEVQQ